MQCILIEKRDLPFYLAIAGIFIVSKLVFSQVSTDDMRYFLLPLDGLLALATNSGSLYLPAQGFYHAQLNILIDKSCSGFNFFVLCFAMLAFLSVRHFAGGRQRVIAMVTCLGLAYALAMFVNGARILASVLLQRIGNPLGYQHTELTHQMEGTFIYLFFLIVIYAVFQFLLTRRARANAERL